MDQRRPGALLHRAGGGPVRARCGHRARPIPRPYIRFVRRSGEPALELGCGDGDPLLDLRARGLDVEGLDSSPDMLARCRANAAARGLVVTLHESPMESMELPPSLPLDLPGRPVVQPAARRRHGLAGPGSHPRPPRARRLGADPAVRARADAAQRARACPAPTTPTTAPPCGSRVVAVERDDAARLQAAAHCATSASATARWSGSSGRGCCTGTPRTASGSSSSDAGLLVDERPRRGRRAARARRDVVRVRRQPRPRLRSDGIGARPAAARGPGAGGGDARPRRGDLRREAQGRDRRGGRRRRARPRRRRPRPRGPVVPHDDRPQTTDRSAQPPGPPTL